MNTGMNALVVGTVLAVVALAFVLYPLFFQVSERPRAPREPAMRADDSPIVALREIEFDRATGKLSEADYSQLKKTYSERALRELRETDRAGGTDAPSSDNAAASSLDAVEAKVREYRLTHRECPTCGVRPEADATYCSTCGGFLDQACPRCATRITEPGAGFCSTCGARLAVSTPSRAPHLSSLTALG